MAHEELVFKIKRKGYLTYISTLTVTILRKRINIRKHSKETKNAMNERIGTSRHGNNGFPLTIPTEQLTILGDKIR